MGKPKKRVDLQILDTLPTNSVPADEPRSIASCRSVRKSATLADEG